jgi:hypothetical protein
VASVISFRIDDEEKDFLIKYAKEFDASISWAARRAIKEFIANKQRSELKDERDNLLIESNGIVSEDGASSEGSNAESKEPKV